ncbi:MAG: hydantoinase B/oxoprolinase family protein [Roseomonas sp.]|jgi:N-methylhydantoinase B|nr:hydantoinase B/oxoprolinase family protein [Roseomonas sp.]MCA3290741.1 hydantoinase B/oxoprolinase family protein [Roseomonas sp.]MCA3296101.1 hydantoinase B/oxoprolinase family protein [Roseomonas sp.]
MFDPVRLELLWTRLVSIVDEAAAALLRSSFSTVVRESHDFGCVLTDAEGRSVVQATDSVPSFLCTLPNTIKHFLREYPAETLSPGDVLITNDIWMGTGHLPDITVAKPIFLDGRLVAFAGSVAHSPDIGGRIRSAEARDVFEEGLQIPPMKAVVAGVPDATLMRMLRRNTRVPDQVLGDLHAQFAALDLMERRILALLPDQGLPDLSALAAEIQSRSERAMRASIAAAPDGIYRAEVLTDGLEQPLRLCLALTVQGDAITCDYAGSDPQVARAINVCLAYTFAYTAFAVKAVLCPGVPNNEGSFVPLTVTAPEGCILNSRHPAAGGARALTGHFLPALVMSALAEALPERVVAGVGSPLWCLGFSGFREDGTPIANALFLNGGYGAHAQGDGANVLSWPSNVSSASVETIEQSAPWRVRFRRLRSGTGGAGRHRGGTGQETLYESRSSQPIAVTFLAERTQPGSAAPGFAGGSPGAPGAVLIDGAAVDPKRQHVVMPGGTVEMRTPGGGGHGLVTARLPELLIADREDGIA